ncbi:MAG: hypothetical protein ACK5LN_03430 [Propioniciclava sp.]
MVDGIVGPATKTAFVNYMARCFGREGSVHLDSQHSGIHLFIDYHSGHVSGDMKIFQEWINAGTEQRLMNITGHGGNRRIVPVNL